MMKQPTPYRDLLAKAVSTRKFLMRTGRSMKDSSRMQQTIMLSEDLLMKMPSEQRVKEFLKRYYAQVRDLIPAQSANDSRIKMLQTALQ